MVTGYVGISGLFVRHWVHIDKIWEGIFPQLGSCMFLGRA